MNIPLDDTGHAAADELYRLRKELRKAQARADDTAELLAALREARTFMDEDAIGSYRQADMVTRIDELIAKHTKRSARCSMTRR